MRDGRKVGPLVLRENKFYWGALYWTGAGYSTYSRDYDLVERLDKPPPEKPEPPSDDAATTDIKEIILRDAIAAVCSDRAKSYGPVEANFSAIATIWNAVLAARYPAQTLPDGTVVAIPKISAADVGPLMIALKLARLAVTPDHYDSWLDVAGYAACAAEVTKAKKP